MTGEGVVVEPLETAPVRGHRRWRPDEPGIAFVLLLVIAGILLMYAGRYLTFFYDEWTFVLVRRGGGIDTYLDPHNGHLSLFPVVIYKLLFATVGLRHYTPYRLVGTALHLLCAGLLYLLARRRVGPLPAVVPGALLLFMGTAYQDLLWPFQIGYLGSIAGGLGALLLLDRPNTRHDAQATALLVLSVVSSGVGLAFAVACGTLLIAQRQPWRRLWVIVLPLLVYAVWYLGWGGGDRTSADAVLAAPEYVADAAAGAVAGLAGLNDATWGSPLVLALLGLIVLAARGRHARGPSPMLLAAATGALVFWVLAAVARATEAEPAASRYLYVGAVFILLAASDVRLGLGLRGAWLALAGVLLVGAVVGNIGALRSGERSLRAADTTVLASLSATEVAAPVVSPTFSPAPIDAPQLTAGPYLAAVRDLGSPAMTPSELQAAPESTREQADSVLVHAERIMPAPSAGALGASVLPATESVFGGGLTTRGGCDVLTPTASLASLGVRVSPGSALIFTASPGPATTLYARRFADSFVAQPIASVSSGPAQVVRFPVDRAPWLTWHLLVVTTKPVTLCARG